jgi:hypothetical protein
MTSEGDPTTRRAPEEVVHVPEVDVSLYEAPLSPHLATFGIAAGLSVEDADRLTPNKGKE